MSNNNECFLAGGCLWGVQEFLRHVPGIITTEAGRANGNSTTTTGPYDGYAECVRVVFDNNRQSIRKLLPYFFEIIDPYSVNQQGVDIGKKYRTGIYSRNPQHLEDAKAFIASRSDHTRVKVEVLTLSNFVSSEPAHQDRLTRCPDDYCHIDKALLHKYRHRHTP